MLTQDGGAPRVPADPNFIYGIDGTGPPHKSEFRIVEIRICDKSILPNNIRLISMVYPISYICGQFVCESSII